jgi:chromosomal replication initiator protein
MEEKLWQSVLGEIELSVSRGSFVTWFKNTVLLATDEAQALVGVPNIFAKQQLEVKYKQQILDSLIANGAKVDDVEFKIHSITMPRATRSETATLSDIDTVATKPVSSQTPQSTNKDGLNTKYVFDSFIVGSSNELAYAACQAISQNPGTKYNPLFVYGGVGLGKTHLIQAVGNEIIKKNPGSKVVYVTSEQFVNDFLDSIRFKKKGFADRYRKADVLIVDDMQFIAGKEKTQEQFFHTFNTLHQANKQIIISSDKPPKSIPTLTERLRSRFEMGMIVDMQLPDFETRCAIIEAKAATLEFNIPKDTVEYLATHIQSNIRELEGGINQLIAFCEMRGMEPDLQVAIGLIGNARMRPKHITARQVIEKTAKHFQVELDELTGPKRDKDIVVPRQIAMYLLRSELHLSFPKVARELGRKDHTTAIHSVEKIEKGINLDQSMRQHVNEIKERLYA